MLLLTAYIKEGRRNLKDALTLDLSKDGVRHLIRRTVPESLRISRSTTSIVWGRGQVPLLQQLMEQFDTCFPISQATQTNTITAPVTVNRLSLDGPLEAIPASVLVIFLYWIRSSSPSILKKMCKENVLKNVLLFLFHRCVTFCQFYQNKVFQALLDILQHLHRTTEFINVISCMNMEVF